MRAVSFFCLLSIAGASLRAASSGRDGFESVVAPFLRENCVRCHNPRLLSGELDLQRFLSQPGAAALQERELWEKVEAKLRSGAMPPPGVPRPPDERIRAVAGWIEQEYQTRDKNQKPDPGRVTARRLNRFEYNNTVRDLLGVRLRAADDFPVDPYGYGFDNIGDVLSLSPVLTEKYLKAAERIARAAVPGGEPRQVVSARYTSQLMGQGFHLHVQTMHDFPADGEYVVHTAWEQGLAAGTKIRGYIYVDGQTVADRQISIYTEMDRGFETAPVFLTQGPHKVETEIVPAPGMKGPKPYPEFIQIRGPLTQPPPEASESYRRIFVCGHPPGHHEAACARRILTPLLHRAYRRPATRDELEQMLGLVRLAQSRNDYFESGLRVAIGAVLMAPNFLFRIEHDPAGGKAHSVSGTELASRLSYFLWSSMPDDLLLSLAEKGRLRDAGVLHGQVRRMMADPRAKALTENFSGQWLQTRNLEALPRDETKFPEFDAEMRDLMRTETQMFFEAVVKEDRSVLDFLDGRFTYLNERLARFYGIDGVQGREFRRVSLDGHQRAGVLTQASVLAVSSYPTRTSPVIRGKWVLENLLNTPPPPPPPDVPAFDEKGVGSSVSVRQRLESHRANPACAGCHSRMDPLGFGLENYDAIGRWRTTDAGLPVDASGVLPDGTKFSGAEELRALLKADKAQFVRALTGKVLTYALGRGLEAYDRPAVEKIATRVERNGFRFSELVEATVDSLPFQMRRGSSPTP
ncbi:MAG: DUF1592 domain-containing protein [Acidobacteriota bacterium]